MIRLANEPGKARAEDKRVGFQGIITCEVISLARGVSMVFSVFDLDISIDKALYSVVFGFLQRAGRR